MPCRQPCRHMPSLTCAFLIPTKVKYPLGAGGAEWHDKEPRETLWGSYGQEH